MISAAKEVGVEETKADQDNSLWTAQLADVDRLTGADLKYRIEELFRIKASVSTELRDLESKRQRLQTEIALFNRRLDEAKGEAGRRRNELDRLQMSVQQARVAEKEAMERNTPRLGRPKPLSPLRGILIHYPSPNSQNNKYCQMDSCFDYSLCPIASPFMFYLYPLTFSNISFTDRGSTDHVGDNYFSNSKINILHKRISQNQYLTNDYLKACMYVLLIENCDYHNVQNLSHSLPYWFGDGRNHVIWINCCCNNEFNQDYRKAFGKAIIVSESASIVHFRVNFDLIVSHWQKAIPSGEVWSHLPPIVPAKRKYLATYLGAETEQSIQSELLKIQQEDPLSFVFQFSCNTYIRNSKWKNAAASENENNIDANLNADSQKSARNLETYTNKKLSNLCENDLLRTRLLLDSTFSLILLPPEDMNVLSSKVLQLRLYECLKYGAIPVILGVRFVPPFDEVIDWSRIVLTLPTSRITEMHYYLKTFQDVDLLAFRKNGRLVFENYLSSIENIVSTVLAALRTRIGIAPSPFEEIPSPSVFNESFTPLKLDSFTTDPEEEENLGPIEPPYASPNFVRNYSTTVLQKYDFWNIHYQPFKLYPFTPWDMSMPSEAKFLGSSLGFRPIANGAGGSGKEFSESLGGNLAKEQFTVVMLTYEREQVLINSLQRLFALPYLNKVVVVWNSPNSPTADLKWPDIGVPVHVVKAQKNSLNNRFLPFDVIETEAVLSIDDDAHLRHDEIVFGFRATYRSPRFTAYHQCQHGSWQHFHWKVWRENRDRIVGFPGRFHAWDLNFGGWLYNSNYSCELSMVLTGAAFYHKVYSYLYTYEMPQAIRDKVEELMNCEDIAMNFLVSHVTQKPPVKVTSRWTFRCPGCPVTLSEDDSHFQERHHCINFFSKVYGYTPLLYTQFRADSILFKTRIPHDKQKCFKYI